MTVRRIDELKPGDMVDLENDTFADPDGSSDYTYELAVVAEIEHETPTCVCVYFENFPPVGFPPEHLVTVHYR